MNKIKLIKRSLKHWVQRRTRGWDDSETWNLDWYLVKWVNSRLKKYKELTIVDLTHDIYEYKGNKFTFGEMIDKIISISEKYSNADNYWSDDDNMPKEIDEMFEILMIIRWALWW